MRSTLKGTILGAAAAGLLFAPLASASQVEDQLQAMQDRMSQMEEQLQATHDDLRAANERADHQATVIRDAGLEDERSATSALSSFLSDTEFYGWVNSSYTLNTHLKGNSANIAGQNNGSSVAVVAPMHSDNMTFQVNQAWIGMDNAATADSRAGFHMDLLFGSDANSAGLGGFGCDQTNNSATNNICVFTANVSYLAPIGPNGVAITMGKMATLLGAEVVESPWNFNITRGLVWGLQPVTNMGAVASADLGSGLALSLGVIDNPIGLADPDNNEAKSFTGQLAWSNDSFGVSVGGNWGDVQNGGTQNNSASILDVVISADPSDNLSLWANFDWVSQEQNGAANSSTIDQYGIAVAGRYALNDTTGLALRGEYVEQTQRSTNDAKQWAITATVDHDVTDNLLLRGEFRYDEAKQRGTTNWFNNPAGNTVYKDQFLFLVDMTYEF